MPFHNLTCQYYRCRVVALVILLTVTASGYGADNPAAIRAAEAYQSANYNEAIELYNSLLQKSPYHAGLHYNLGNAYYKAGRIGPAILHYEKAALLAPADKAVRHNLQIARNRVTDNVAPLPSFFLARWWQTLAALLSPVTWNMLGFILLWAGAACGVAYHWMSSPRLRRLGLWIGIVASFSAILPFALAKSRTGILQNSGYAVVMDEGAQLRSAPEAQQTMEPLHEGYKVELLDAIGDWRKVQLPNGDIGWVESRVLEKI